MKLTKSEIDQLEHIQKINLINSISGIKPANLIGTQSKGGQTNLAVISSVVHLGSNPPLFGYILRPTGEVPRHSYENILATEHYTINHIHQDFIEQAHYTSAKFDREISEFEACKIPHQYIDDFPAPFVKGSLIKFGLKLVDTISIPVNGTLMVIGEVQILEIDDRCITPEGYIDLSAISGVGISGLNSYYSLNKLEDFPYARVQELPKWNEEK